MVLIGVANWIQIAVACAQDNFVLIIDQGPDLLDSGTALSNASAIVSIISNTVIAIVIAGRIWWILSEVGSRIGKGVSDDYRAIVALILESGLLYPFTQLLSFVFDRNLASDESGTYTPIVLSIIPVLVAGIAPTLIIIRSVLGKTIETVDQLILTMLEERKSAAPRARGGITPFDSDMSVPPVPPPKQLLGNPAERVRGEAGAQEQHASIAMSEANRPPPSYFTLA
ncbi:hypothetical protein V5O48_006361 [Marasmius crinis-equi]|uniref:Uncharacterized protein n=1 Tax=Marasmius crinis-equi TaxID=585013 RepID=A0ABR3FK97_9AGAR